MDIFFCDICNESVPQTHLEKGLAVRRGDRVMCVSCDLSMSGSAQSGAESHTSEASFAASAATMIDGGERPRLDPGPMDTPVVPISLGTPFQDPSQPGAEGAAAPTVGRRRNRQGAGALILGLMALAFASISTAVLLEKLEVMYDENEALSKDIGAAARSTANQISALESAFKEELQFQVIQLESRQDEVLVRWTESLGALKGELESAGRNVAGLKDDLAEMRVDQRTLLSGLDERLAAFATAIDDQAADVTFNYNKSIELQERLAGLTSGSSLMAAAGGRPLGGGAQNTNTPSWHEQLPDLNSPQDGLRLEAIYALGDTGDGDVVPYIIPMLKDVDLFVRMATCRVLEDLKARSAVPALIDALEDQETAVQESAMIALHRITTKNFGFEPNQSGGERSKKVKVWRDWWKKNGEQFAGTGA